MKLRNKKTGEVWNVWSFYDGNQTISLKYFNNDGAVNLEYSSLAKLNEDWEDYEPVETIFDEKIRRGIRAWWDMQDNPFKFACVLLQSKNKDRDGFYHWTIFGYIRNGVERIATEMNFRTKKLYDYDSSHDYTKEELCGEEKE